jgi:CBS domain-containing protein
VSKISSILSGKSNELWSVKSDDLVHDAIRLMADKGIGAVLVIDDGMLSGILSERDYARKIFLENRSSSTAKVSDIMTSDVITITSDHSINECMTMMTDNDFRHLPVVENQKVLGMVSIGDLVKAVIKEQQFTITQLEQYISG